MIRIPFTNIYVGTVTPKGASYSGSALINLIGSSQQKKISTTSMYDAYRDNVDIYACIREWRETVGSGGLYFYDPRSNQSEVPQTIQDDILRVLNYFQDYRYLRSNTVRDLGVTGNGYWEIVRNENMTVIVGLNRLDPRTIRIVANENGQIIRYIQRIKEKTVEFNPEDVIHFKLDCDPDNDLFGFSPVEPIMWEAMTDLEAKKTNHFFFLNKAVPGALYIIDEKLSPEQQKEAIKNLKIATEGSEKNNKSVAISGIKEIKQYNISQRDMEYINGRKYMTEKICSAFGVPSFLLGYGENTNINNGNNFMTKFYEGTISPLEQTMLDTQNKKLLTQMGYYEQARMGYSPLTYKDEAQIETRALNEKNSGALTLRQYKIKTGQEITEEDEQNPNFDKYIFTQGASAVLLEDIGVDPVFDTNNEEQINKILSVIKDKYASIGK